MSDESAPVTVVVTTDGPYRVTGPVTVDHQVAALDGTGANWTWKSADPVETRRTFLLCRCGNSQNKPFCDNSHLRVGFDGTETASRETYDEQAGVIDGPTMSLADAQSLCAKARFCQGYGDTWNAVESSSTDEARRTAAHEASHCPAGRLVAYDKSADGAALEPDLEPSIGIIEDPAVGVSGGLWLRGGIRVASEDGTPYPVRNRAVLCRCGASENKPFCDGSHRRTRFADDRLSTYDATADGTDSVTTPSV